MSCRLDSWVRKIPWRRKWQPTPVFLAWKIPWTEEPGELQSIRLPRVEHDSAYTHTQAVNNVERAFECIRIDYHIYITSGVIPSTHLKRRIL